MTVTAVNSILAWVVTGVAGTLAIVMIWLVRRWQRAFLENARESELAYGTVTLEDGREFPVASLRLREGGFEFTFGFSGAMEGGPQEVTVRGADGVLVARVEIIFPRRFAFDPMLFCTGTFRVDPENLLTDQ